MPRLPLIIRDYIDVVSQPTVVRLDQLRSEDPAWISDSYYITAGSAKYLKAIRTVLSKDQGSGIPTSEQDHIFEKFTRLRGKGKAGGLGIGLAFCRLAVQGHGGRIWVESDTDKGSTFHFTFPIATKEQLSGSASAG